MTSQALRRAQIRDGLVYWVYLPAAVVGGGWALDRLAGLPPLPGGWWLTGAAGLLFLAGNALIGRSMRELQTFGEGTPNPRFPPHRLVTAGSYSWCRHPMFLGYDLAALGVILGLHSTGMLAMGGTLFFLLQISFLRREEKLLEKRFGADFRAYRQRVPFLLPRPWRK